MKTIWMALGLVLAVGTGCGSLSAGGGTFGCDTNQNGMHTCSEIAWTGAAGAPACSSPATKVDACSRTGADGGCKGMTITLVGYSTTGTQWYYAGKAAMEMADCQKSGGTWITP